LSLFKWECHDHIASILVSFIITYLVLVVTTFIDTNGTEVPMQPDDREVHLRKADVFQSADPILLYPITFHLWGWLSPK
jgi:hypothetical protein